MNPVGVKRSRESSTIRLVSALAVVTAFAMPGSGAQTLRSGPPSCAAVHAASEFVEAWTSAVIGPGNRDHTCLRLLLSPDARLVGAVPGEDGHTSLIVETSDEFIGWYEKRGTETFWERTLHSSADVYENVARVTRTYEVRASPTGPVQATGIEDFQLIFDGREWRAFALLWQDEAKGRPLPRRYRPD